MPSSPQIRAATITEPNRRPGYAHLHNTVVDHSRFAYTEILEDEKQETAAGFWERVNEAFNAAGIAVKRVLTDNGSSRRSHAFKVPWAPDIKHKRTRALPDPNQRPSIERLRSSPGRRNAG